ncbi:MULTISPECIES: hypothetical protein [Pseudoalteromonas]|uniref:Uncharacterized protein n=1 Tax=Pseudoalteromonas fuliginea TaxID=1872678 RepID=A0ABD3YD50_9GAMM|nr:hypothetical protein [Pseudoalteromonas fuliginea]KDC52873.1 hypothetical protein DC53_02805 [Pseudoalteromonas fuliginea]KJZ27493.1 hypothetical protein TW82_12095 [Pseudoalteromonas fuliginea]
MNESTKIELAALYLKLYPWVRIAINIFILFFAISWVINSSDELKEPIIVTMLAASAVLDMVATLFDKAAKQLSSGRL